MYLYSFPQFLGTFPDFFTISGLKIQKNWRYAPFLLYMKPNLCTEHAPAPKMPQKQGRNSFWGILRVGEEIRIFGQNIDPWRELMQQVLSDASGVFSKNDADIGDVPEFQMPIHLEDRVRDGGVQTNSTTLISGG